MQLLKLQDYRDDSVNTQAHTHAHTQSTHTHTTARVESISDGKVYSQDTQETNAKVVVSVIC